MEGRMSTDDAVIAALGILAKAISDGDNSLLDLVKQLTVNVIDLTQCVNTLANRVEVLEHELLMIKK